MKPFHSTMTSIRFALVAFIFALTSLSSCKTETTKSPTSPKPAVASSPSPSSTPTSEEQLKQSCVDTGGKWDARINDCDCTTNMRWTGFECEVRESTSTGPGSAALKAACDKAKGSWNTVDSYCGCPDRKTLLGESCEALEAGLNEDACRKALAPGIWRSGLCLCDEGKVFSLPRGGCAAKYQGNVSFLQRQCESLLNNGKWDSTRRRCDCPVKTPARIWHEEICQPRDGLQDKLLCEGDFNQGTWKTETGSCQCQVGFTWIKKNCESLQTIPAKDACESDVNKGTWDAARTTCVCPGNKAWLSSLKSCETGEVSGWQQLCIQSGGAPGQQTGTCVCSQGLEVKVLKPQNFQYCVPKSQDSNPVPIWLQILLGILK